VIQCLSKEGNDKAIKMKSRVMPNLSSSSPGSSSGSGCLNHSVWVVHKYSSILNCKAQMRKRGYRYTHYKTKSLLILISPVMNSCAEENNLQLPFKISVLLVVYYAFCSGNVNMRNDITWLSCLFTINSLAVEDLRFSQQQCLNIQVFWEVMCYLVSSPQHSEGSECLHLYWAAWSRRIIHCVS
jgi:hypothetical protein